MGDREVKINQTGNYLAHLIGSKIGKEPESIDKGESFFTLGIDSIVLQEIMSELDKTYDHLPPTLLFEYPNIYQLAGYLQDKETKGDENKIPSDDHPISEISLSIPDPEKVSPTSASEKVSPFIQETTVKEKGSVEEEEPFSTKIVEIQLVSPDDLNQDDLKAISSPLSATASETKPQITKPLTFHQSYQRGYDIAVIGMSGRFPKSPDLDAYWQNLLEGRDCIEEIPKDRWELERFFDPDPNKPNTSYGKWGGFIEDIDKFDPLFFNISPVEAEQMDPPAEAAS